MSLVLLLLFGCGISTAQPETHDAIFEQLQTLRDAAEASPTAVEELRRIEEQVTPDSAYPLRRELMLAQLSVLREGMSFADTLALMQSLRELAESNGDSGTVTLMDINRIYMGHADDDIDTFIGQLNEIRARISSDASAEVMEALEHSYGNMYFDAGNFDTALRHQLAALDWSDKLSGGSQRARLYRLSTIAELYNAMGLPDQALEYVERAYKPDGPQMPPQNQIALLGARSMALIQQGRLPEADVAISQAEQLNRQDPSDFAAMRIGTQRADLYLAMQMPDDAIGAINHIESIAKKNDNSYYVAKSWMLRGDALMQLDQIDEGLQLMNKASEYFESKGQMIDLLAGMDRQIRTLRDKRLYRRAIARMEDRQQLWAQLFRNERGRAIAEVEARHTAESLEHQIDTLSTENRVQQERLRAEKLGKALAIVLALFGISLSAFLFFAIRRARRERDTLSTAVRFDSLTGAFSRYQFQHRAASKPADREHSGATAGLLLIDLDQFKSINDQHGHEAGDAVLKAVVSRIRQVLGDDAEIYRWGGEEFLVVLNRRDGRTLQDDALDILREIERTPVPWHDHSMKVSVSGGLVCHPLASGWQAPLADAIRWADAALYQAKHAGRRRVEQVELTDRGSRELKDRRPVDLAELLDWQRRGYLTMHTLRLPS